MVLVEQVGEWRMRMRMRMRMKRDIVLYSFKEEVKLHEAYLISFVERDKSGIGNFGTL